MLTRRIYRQALAKPDKPALIYDDVLFSYADFARRIESVRKFLSAQQLAPPQVAIVLVKNLLDVWTATLALRALGVTTICVQSIASARDLEVDDAGCWIVSQRELRLHGVSTPELDGKPVVVIPQSVLDGPHARDLPATLGDETPFGSHIAYTSGTTGVYKKVLFEGRKDGKTNDWWVRSLGFNEGTTYQLLSFPLWTAAGFGFPAAVWQAGGCVVLDQRPSPLERLFKHPVTNAFLVPALVGELLAGPSSWTPPPDFELSVGGGFLPLAHARSLRDKLAGRLRITYASTECIAVLHAFFAVDDDLYWLTPYPDRIVEVVDTADCLCADGSEGSLRIALKETDATGYLDDAETTARFFRNGHFHPGDMAVKRQDGRIRILGRVADVLNVRGTKVASAPIEEAIQQHLGVSAVCVFSGIDRDGTERLIVALESERPIAKAQLAEIAKIEMFSRVAGSFGSFRFCHMKAFPRTPTAMRKIDRIALKQAVFGRTY